MSLGIIPSTTELTPLISLQVLFNDTIKHNIQYGRLSATDEEAWSSSNTFWSCGHMLVLESWCLFTYRFTMLLGVLPFMIQSWTFLRSMTQLLESEDWRWDIVWLCAKKGNFTTYFIANTSTHLKKMCFLHFAVEWRWEATGINSSCILEGASHSVSAPCFCCLAPSLPASLLHLDFGVNWPY